MTDYAVVLTAFPNEELAKQMARNLLEKKLAACVQLFPINSFYWWDDKICDDSEIMLFIKCNKKHYAQIEAAIIEKHTYETPEIIMIPVNAGFSKYLGWIDDVCK